MQMPIPDRIVLNLAANSRRLILRDMARLAAQDLGLHAVGLHHYLTAPDQGMIETRTAPGVLMFDGCISGVDKAYIMVVRPVHPVSMGDGSPHPVELMLLVISPDTDHSGHVRRINGLIRFLKQPNALSAVRSAANVDQVMGLFLADSMPSVRAA